MVVGAPASLTSFQEPLSVILHTDQCGARLDAPPTVPDYSPLSLLTYIVFSPGNALYNAS
jgi:hypothetical protein